MLDNDIDIDGDTLTIVSKTNGAHGVVTITGGGTGLTYDPNQLYVGTDVFTYTVSDGHGGTDTATVLLTVVKDTVKPVATGADRGVLRPDRRHDPRRSSGSPGPGSDAGTGRRQVPAPGQASDGGSWSTVSLPSATSTIDQPDPRRRTRLPIPRPGDGPRRATSAPGRTARRSRRAGSRTRAGASPTSGRGRRSRPARALGGSHRWSGSSSARATLTRSVRDFALVATKTPNSGSVQVWIDGSLAATIDLHKASAKYRKLVFSRHFASLATHTIEIRPVGNGRVYLDAFLVLR